MEKMCAICRKIKPEAEFRLMKRKRKKGDSPLQELILQGM